MPVAQSDAIRRNRTQSDAIGRNRTQSDAIRRNQTQSEPWPVAQSAVLSGLWRPSGRNQRSSGRNQRPSARLCRPPVIRTQSEAISVPVPPAGRPRRRAVSRDGEGNGRCTRSRAGKTRPTRPGFRRARARATLRRPARTGRSRVIMTQSERSQNALRTQSLRTQDAIRAHSVRTQYAIRTQSAYLQARDARERVDGVVGEK